MSIVCGDVAKNAALSGAKRRRLESVSSAQGTIAALAMDQRNSLRTLIAAAERAPIESVAGSRLAEFKAAVTSALSPHASAVLLDPEYGLDAVRLRARHCGLLMTYEADGFQNPRPHRMLALLPRMSVRRLRDLGADGIKILLSWAPDDVECANEEKCALVERIGHECEALGMPFLLEPVVYCGTGEDPKSVSFLRRKPDLVVRAMEEFSKPVYRVDVLKVEFPVGASLVEGTAGNGNRLWTKGDALEWYRTADSVARRPYVYLSAGIDLAEFTASLRIAAEAGARFSGVLCGRATWQDGVAAYVAQGRAALDAWLEGEGVRNIRAINECLRAATPWHRFLEPGKG